MFIYIIIKDFNISE